MEKEKLLEQIKQFARENIITKEEILTAYNQAARIENEPAPKLTISNILYFLGAAVVFTGIAIFIGQNWSRLNNITKIIATLGVAIAAYISGVLLNRYKKLDLISQASFFISMLVMPLGLHIVFDIAGLDIGSLSAQTSISGILFITFLATYLIFKKHIFDIFNVIFGTWLFFAVTELLLKDKLAFHDFSEYRTLFIGLAYIFLGYWYSENKKIVFSRVIYCFGICSFLGAALALSGWQAYSNMFWEIIFPGFAFGIIFLGIYLKSKVFPTFGSLFLLAYISKITHNYFTASIGWPLSLVLIGLALISIGYFTVFITKKYI